MSIYEYVYTYILKIYWTYTYIRVIINIEGREYLKSKIESQLSKGVIKVKLKIGEWEVTITAKNRNCSALKTTDFLNNLSIAYFECAERQRMLGASALVSEYKRSSEDIYNFLDSKGVYDKKKV